MYEKEAQSWPKIRKIMYICINEPSFIKKCLHHRNQWTKLPYQPNLAPSRAIFGVSLNSLKCDGFFHSLVPRVLNIFDSQAKVREAEGVDSAFLLLDWF